MNFQPRTVVMAVALASTLVACSEDGDFEPTGERTLITGTTIPLIGPQGTDLTAVNEVNFPQPIEVIGGFSSGAGGGTDPNGQPTTVPNAPGTYFLGVGAFGVAEQYTAETGFMVDLVSTIVAPEYFAEGGSAAYNDDTLNIIKRISDRALNCGSGSAVSLAVENGSITQGSVIIDGCEILGATTSGEIELSTTNDVLRIEFKEFETDPFYLNQYSFNGVVSVTPVGEELRIADEGLTYMRGPNEHSWANTDLIAQITSTGDRVLNGTTTLNLPNGKSVSYGASNIQVPAGTETAASGSAELRANDGTSTSITFRNGQDISYIVRRGGTIEDQSFETNWETANTYVPELPAP